MARRISRASILELVTFLTMENSTCVSSCHLLSPRRCVILSDCERDQKKVNDVRSVEWREQFRQREREMQTKRV